MILKVTPSSKLVRLSLIPSKACQWFTFHNKNENLQLIAKLNTRKHSHSLIMRKNWNLLKVVSPKIVQGKDILAMKELIKKQEKLLILCFITTRNNIIWQLILSKSLYLTYSIEWKLNNYLNICSKKSNRFRCINSLQQVLKVTLFPVRNAKLETKINLKWSPLWQWRRI